MVTLTIDEIQNKLEQLADIDEPALRKASIRELKKLAAGVVSGYGNMKKEDLVLAILEVTEATKQRRREAEERLAKSAKLNREALEDWEQNPVTRATKIYGDIKEVATTSLNHDEMLQRVSGLVAGFYEREKQFEATSRKSNRTKFKQVMTDLLASEEEFAQSRVKTAVDLFLNMVASMYRAEVTALNSAYHDTVASKQNDLSKVSIKGLYEQAKRVLASPTDYPWVEVSKALALVTGRRSAELHTITTEFEPYDENHVRFSGQLKVKTRTDVESYVIPTLVPASQVLEAIDYLTQLGKRFSDPTAAHKGTSKQLSRAFEGTEFTMKELRAVYAEIAAHRFYDAKRQVITDEVLAPDDGSSCSKNVFFQKILGHASNDIQTGLSYQKYSVEDLEDLS